MAAAPARDIQPLVVIAHDDPATADGLRHAVETAAGWRTVVAEPNAAGLAAALAGGPTAALVGCGVLPDLPSPSQVPVLAVGDDNRPADLRAALAAGARGLVTWPDGVADLATELTRVASTTRPEPRTDSAALVIAVRGVQGGAGTSTLAAHLAGGWAKFGPGPVLLADLAGGLGFRLDLGPGARTWSSLAETAPDLDGALTSEVLASPLPDLTVLPLAGLADGAPEPPPEPWVVQAVLQAARATYPLILLDLPLWDGPPMATAMTEADVLLAVSRPESSGVRALQAQLAGWVATGRAPESAGAVVVGAAARAPMAIRDVRAGLGEALWGVIPSAAPELCAAAEDGVLLLDRPELPAVQAMLALANRVMPFRAVSR